MEISDLLTKGVELGCSDLHLSAGMPPCFRIDGDIKKIKTSPMEHKDVHSMVYDIMNDKQRKDFEEFLECDFSFEIPKLARFRVNAFNHNRGAGAVFRTIPSEILSLEKLGAPNIFKEISDYPRGVVLVTGPTGSGKSTTLAAMVDHKNDTEYGHILTVEDPIEFVHSNKQSIISQREVGKDTQSFASAIKAALREDPDIILLGELRDYETISLALTAAETGHLVFGTLHTSGASSTINRIVDAFPASEQGQARSQLSTSLQMVMTQRLFKKKDGSGRVGAFELMVCTSAIRNLIREAKIPQIDQMIETGAQAGMVQMSKSIENLVVTNIIDQPPDS